MRDLFGGSNSIAETLEEKKEEGKKRIARRVQVLDE
jgi:hypothetical protein